MNAVRVDAGWATAVDVEEIADWLEELVRWDVRCGGNWGYSDDGVRWACGCHVEEVAVEDLRRGRINAMGLEDIKPHWGHTQSA